MLANKTVHDLLNAFSSPDPTPGGGSAAALAGALGASLLAMVAGMSKTKHGTPEEFETLGAARADIVDARSRLVELIDQDTAAYNEVVAAYRLPKGADAEKAARTAAIQAAMRRATEVPLETMRVALDVLSKCKVVGECGNPNAASDVGVAVSLAMAAFNGGRLNAETNLPGLTDLAYVTSARQEISELAAKAAAALGPAYQSLGWPGPEPAGA